MTRRRGLIAALVLAFGVGGALAGAAGVSRQVDATLEARGVHADEVSFGLHSVVLTGVTAGPIVADRVDVDVWAWLTGTLEATVTGAHLRLEDREARSDAGEGGVPHRPLAITLVDATVQAHGFEARVASGRIDRDPAGRWAITVAGELVGLGEAGANAPFSAEAQRAGEDHLTANATGLDLTRIGATLGHAVPPGLGRVWVEILDDRAEIGFDGVVTAPIPGGDVTAPTRVSIVGDVDAFVRQAGPVMVDAVWSGIPARALGDLASAKLLLAADPHAPVGPPAGATRSDAWVVVLDDVPVSDLLATPPLAGLDPRIAAAKVTGRISVVTSVAWTGATWEVDPLVSIDDLVVTGVANTGAWRGGPFPHTIRLADGTAGTRTTGEGTPGWTPRAAVPEALVLALLAAEDAWFYHHDGFTISAQRAAWHEHSIPHGLRRGGSTLTQQLAKNLVSGRDHSMRRKLVELLAASQIERELGKKRILELYLNIVELGPGIYGVGDGARAWFGKPVSALTPGESLWLVMCLPSPRRMWRDAPPGDDLGPWAQRFYELRGKLGELGIDVATVDRPQLRPR